MISPSDAPEQTIQDGGICIIGGKKQLNSRAEEPVHA